MRHGSHSTQNGGPPRDESISIDTVLQALSDENRRHVLRYLHANDKDIASFDELAEHVTAANPSIRDPKRVTIALHHWILPMLEETGAVEYDTRSETVRYRRHPLVGTLLDRVDQLNVTR